MLIDDAPVPFIFFGIPKNASSSMRDALRQHSFRIGPRGTHSHVENATAGQLRGVYRKLIRDTTGSVGAHGGLDAYFKWTFVRNPWDRLVSMYEFTCGINRVGRVPRTGPRSFDTSTFKAYVQDIADAWARAEEKGHNDCEDLTLVKPQWCWVSDDDMCIHVDFTGRYEDIGVDWKRLCSHLQLKHGGIGHVNQSNRRHRRYHDYFCPLTRRLAWEVYGRDAELWDYEF